MNGEVGTEAVRPRPLSGGLWTLFSWLRREDRLSTESISSVGSDRTVASFAFLGPGNYTNAAPLLLPPQGPPTDSYKKRVRDRNLRWQHDRDITIHRKYGLYGYDAFSLPNARRAAGGSSADRCERDRRAASESFPRRAHVPGKRRAPLPPASTAPTTLNRRRARKRQAPQPPSNTAQKHKQDETTSKTDVKMNSDNNRRIYQEIDVSPEASNKYEKKYKKDIHRKDPKVKHEKSFLKQIFENKKRNSTIDTNTVKLLPNISELDKQAAELIEKYKLKELNPKLNNGNSDNNLPGPSRQLIESWICTRCLRKYNGSVVTCSFCLPLHKSVYNDSNKSNRLSNSFTQTNNPQVVSEPSEDKEKLREMLKEMKDSLRKKPTKELEVIQKSEKETKDDYPRIVETPTLRIGSTVTIIRDENKSPQPSSSKEPTIVPKLNNLSELVRIDSVVVTQPVVLEHTKENIVELDDKLGLARRTNDKVTKISNNQEASDLKSKSIKENENNKALKISSLLNPIYVPKAPISNASTQHNNQPVATSSTCNENNVKINVSVANTSASKAQTNDSSIIKTIVTANVTSKNKEHPKDKKIEPKAAIALTTTKETKPLENNNAPASSTSNQATSNIVTKLDEHSRRRELVQQLEQSIAKGDEGAAADAAIKLAQLRLTCSVLSFSSQIMSEPSPSTSKTASTSNELTTNKISSSSSQIPTKPSTTIIGLALNQNNVPKFPKILFNQTKETASKSILNDVLVKKEKSPTITEDKSPKNLAQPNTASDKVNPVISIKPKPDVIKGDPTTSSLATTSQQLKTDDDGEVPILVWVEDKDTTRGPVQLHIRRKATVRELREQADKSLGLAVKMQRWIVGKTLCADDNTVLVKVAGPELKAPFYLCLVEPDPKANAKVENKEDENVGDVYKELVNLEKQALVANAEVFECGVCIEQCPTGEGVVLRDCIHSFCKECLADVVRHSEEPIVTCPAMGCRGILQEREIRGLVSPEDYQKWLARGLAVAESGTRNAFHCRTRDCTGWALCEPGVRRFPCPVCKHINCVPCQAIHEGETCVQYKANLVKAANTTEAGQTDDGTQELLNNLISRGEALECPECKAIITKKWGCDWVKCSACKTEICWVTRGRRWGPGGRGDTSGGCRCGVDGKKCHPSCSYCH